MTQTSDPYVYYNGVICLKSAVRIHPDDRGFLLGDGAFETLRVFAGTPYLLNEHLQRLSKTLSDLQIPFDAFSLKTPIHELLEIAHADEAMLRITVTRGVGGAGYLPRLPTSPTVFITYRTLTSSELITTPVELIISPWRKIPPECLPTEGKTLQGLNATLARMGADQPYREALQLSYDGHLACVSSGNLFWQVDGVLYTPPLRTGCLGGITRQRILSLNKGHGEEMLAVLSDLAQADAVFYTNSRILACPVASIEGLPYAFSQSEHVAKKWRRTLENDANS